MQPSGGDGTGYEDDDVERTCDSLLMCIVTVLSHGLRSGGGVGDVLRKPSKEVRAPPIEPQSFMPTHVFAQDLQLRC